MFSFGLAKQLSLSSTTARISGSWPPFAKAKVLDMGKEMPSKVGTVTWGKHKEGFTRSLIALKVAETFIGRDRNQIGCDVLAVALFRLGGSLSPMSAGSKWPTSFNRSCSPCSSFIVCAFGLPWRARLGYRSSFLTKLRLFPPTFD